MDGGKVADSVFVVMADQPYSRSSWIQASEIVVSNGAADVAVLKLANYRGPYVKQLDWYGTNVVQGEAAALIGILLNEISTLQGTDTVRMSMSVGILSKIDGTSMQFDGFGAGLTSGSPVLSVTGQVVGIHRAPLASAPGVSFPVPIGLVRGLLPLAAQRELGLP